ncbi:MAG: hypothetical protein VYD95_03365, partial [Pseudomonadota bacterium]|nr:hypothetical protein [Pseudomonadota bacterium]
MNKFLKLKDAELVIGADEKNKIFDPVEGIHVTAEGIALKSFYTDKDTEDISFQYSLPGLDPYVRG